MYNIINKKTKDVIYKTKCADDVANTLFEIAELEAEDSTPLEYILKWIEENLSVEIDK